jgi:hypothetical protein
LHSPGVVVRRHRAKVANVPTPLELTNIENDVAATMLKAGFELQIFCAYKKTGSIGMAGAIDDWASDGLSRSRAIFWWHAVCGLPQSSRRLLGLSIPFARLIDPRDPPIERMLQDLGIACKFVGNRTLNFSMVTLGLLGNPIMFDLKFGCLLTLRTMKHALPVELVDFCIDASTKLGEFLTELINIIRHRCSSGFSTAYVRASMLRHWRTLYSPRSIGPKT